MEWRKLIAQCLVFYWAVYVIRESPQREQGGSASLSFKWIEVVGEKIHLRHVFIGVLIGTALLSSFALVDFIERGGNWQDRTIRAIVPGSDYNWLSTYMVLAIPIVFYCAIRFRVLWGKIFSCCTLVLALFAHAASYTRAGWLASMAQLFTWGLVTGRRLFISGLILVIFLVAVSLVGIAQMGYQTDTLDTWTLETRMQVWKLGVGEIISHPLVGIGYGNNIFRPVLPDSPMGAKPMHLHNTPLMVGVGTGIPGLLLFLWVFLRLGVALFPKKNPKDWKDSETLKLCFGIVLVGFFSRNLFDYMFIGSLSYLFWILMACGLESSVKSMQQPEPQHSHCAIGTKGNGDC